VSEMVKPKQHPRDPFLRDVRRAFQVVAAQLVAIMLIVILYYNYVMIEEIAQPFFWAVVFSIFLHEPRQIILKGLKPLESVEANNSGWLRKRRAKFLWMITHPLLLKFAFYYAIIAAATYGAAIILGWSCPPWFWITLVVACLYLLVSMWVAHTDAEEFPGMVATFLVASLVLGVVGFIVFFVFQAVVETSVFVMKVKVFAEEKVNDPMWGEYMTEYNITSAKIDEYVSTGYEYVDNWATEQGYNLTEIRETIEEFQQNFLSKSANTTLTSDPAMVDKAKGFVENVDFYALYEQLQEYASSIMNVTDVIMSSGEKIASVFAEVVAFLGGFVSYTLDFLAFVGALMFFLESENSLVESAMTIIPIPAENQRQVTEAIRSNMSQILLVSLLLAVSHGLATFMYFSVWGVDFAYCAAFLTGLTTLFPLLSPWLVHGPALFALYLSGRSVVYNLVFLLGCEWALGAFVDDYIYGMIPNSHPYLAGLAMGLGVSTFGGSGILLGPLLLVLAKTFFEIFSNNLAENRSDLKALRKKKKSGSTV